MAVMRGFPPASVDRANLGNWRQAPYCHWAFHHVREIVPTAEIAHAPDQVWALGQGSHDIPPAVLEAAIAGIQTDALVIAHRGQIVHETYRNGMTARDPHILMSVSKSMLGLLAGTLVAAGQLDEAAPLTHYLPEMAETGYAGATVRDALDMRVGVAFEEDYFTTEGPIIEYRYAANWNPLPDGHTPYDLRSFQSLMTDRDGPHNGRFHYVSPVTDLLAWVCERASGKRYADLLSENLWQPMGAEAPGYITVDRIGGPRAAGGVCVTARDLARVGLLVAAGGARDGRQIIPEGWIRDILTNADKDAWRDGDFAEKFAPFDMAYRSKWYVHGGEAPLVHGLGIHGQFLFIDPTRELSIAWLSSENDPINETWSHHVLNSVAALRRFF